MSRFILKGAELAQKDYVDEALSNIDLSEYATIDYINNTMTESHIARANDAPTYLIQVNNQYELAGSYWFGSYLTRMSEIIRECIENQYTSCRVIGIIKNVSTFLNYYSGELASRSYTLTNIPQSLNDIPSSGYSVRCLLSENYTQFRASNSRADDSHYADIGTNTYLLPLNYDSDTDILTVNTYGGYGHQVTVADKEYYRVNYLKKDNTIAYTPVSAYNPATKKYVDDSAQIIQYEEMPENAAAGQIIQFVGSATGNLPAEYQEVEYIQSVRTGSMGDEHAGPCIDTGIPATSDLKIEVGLINPDLSIQNGVVYGGGVNWNNQYLQGECDSECCFHYGNTMIQVTGFTTADAIEFTQDKNKVYIGNNTSPAATWSDGAFSTNDNIFIFCHNRSGSHREYGEFKLYKFNIYDNDVLVRHYIPCYRKSDNEIGLYDLVSQQFFGNSDVGSFLKGADVNPISTYTKGYFYKCIYTPITPAVANQLDKVTVNQGTWVDTGIIPSNHKVEMCFAWNYYYNDSHVFGTEWSGSGSEHMHFTSYDDKYYWGTTGIEEHGGTFTTGKHTVIFNADENDSLIFDGETLSTSFSDSSTQITLFAREGAANFDGDFYYFKVWDRDTGDLIMHLVPYLNSNDEASLYDLVSETEFAPNGSFVPGTTDLHTVSWEQVNVQPAPDLSNYATTTYVDNSINSLIIEATHYRMGNDINASYTMHDYLCGGGLSVSGVDNITITSEVANAIKAVFNDALPYFKGQNVRHCLNIRFRGTQSIIQWNFGNGYGWKPTGWQSIYAYLIEPQFTGCKTIQLLPTFNADDTISGFADAGHNAIYDGIHLLGCSNTTVYTPTGDYHPATKKYVDDNLPDLTNYATKSYVDKKIYILNETGTGSNFVINTEANKATLANIIQDIRLGETPAVFLRSKHGIDGNNSNYIYPLTYNENNGFWAITNPNTRGQERFYGIDYHSVAYYNISWNATITDEGVTVSSIGMSATNTKILMDNNFTVGDFRVPLGVKNTSTYIPTNDYNPATKKYVDDTISTSINNKIWIGTQAEYDALSSYSDDTLYFIKETQPTSY